MVMETLVFVFSAMLSFNVGYAKSEKNPLLAYGCFKCIGFVNDVCVNIDADTKLAQKTVDHCRENRENLTYDMQQTFGQRFVSITKFEPKVRCVRFEKQYNFGKEEYTGCMRWIFAKDFCERQLHNEDIYYYNLTTCITCRSRKCYNLASKFGANVIVSFFIAIIINSY